MRLVCTHVVHSAASSLAFADMLCVSEARVPLGREGVVHARLLEEHFPRRCKVRVLWVHRANVAMHEGWQPARAQPQTREQQSAESGVGTMMACAQHGGTLWAEYCRLARREAPWPRGRESNSKLFAVLRLWN